MSKSIPRQASPAPAPAAGDYLRDMAETHFGRRATRAIVNAFAQLGDYDIVVLTRGAQRLYELYSEGMPMPGNVYTETGMARIRREPRNRKICVFTDMLENGDRELDMADTLAKTGFGWIEVRSVFAPVVSKTTQKERARRSPDAGRLAEEAVREADMSGPTAEYYGMKARQLPLLTGQPLRDLCPVCRITAEDMERLKAREGTETVRQEITITEEDGRRIASEISYLYDPQADIFMTAVENPEIPGVQLQIQDWGFSPGNLSLSDSYADEVVTGRGPVARAYNMALGRYLALKGLFEEYLESRGITDYEPDLDRERLWFSDPDGRIEAAYEGKESVAWDRTRSRDIQRMDRTLAANIARNLAGCAEKLAEIDGDPAGQAQILYKAYTAILKANRRMKESRRIEGVPVTKLHIPAEALARPADVHRTVQGADAKAQKVLESLPPQVPYMALSMLTAQGYADVEFREYTVDGPSSYIEPTRFLDNTYFYEIGE